MDRIDAAIGKGIRHYRWLQGISPAELARAVGITEAQLRSNEAGKSRISAARLLAIAAHLGVEVSALFQRNPDVPAVPSPSGAARARPAGDSVQNGKYLAALMTHFQRLNDQQKQAVLQLVMSIARQGSAATAIDGQALGEIVGQDGAANSQRRGDGSY